MKYLMFCALMCSLTLFGCSQEKDLSVCEIEISSTAIKGSEDLGGSGGNVRIVDMGEFVENNGGGGNVYYIFNKGEVNQNGGGSHMIYVKSGGVLNISGGGGSIMVYFEEGAIINNTLSGGGNNHFKECKEILF